jgi:hypothetical protein
MKVLCLYAGPLARQHLERHGLQVHDVTSIPAAAGGPKGLILGALDRFIFGSWLAQTTQEIHLVYMACRSISRYSSAVAIRGLVLWQ